jgi:signal transduction histidine kinase
MHSALAKTLEVSLGEKYETKAYMTYTLAKETNETVHDLANRKWTKTKKNFNLSQYATSAYWVKIKLKNISDVKKSYYLKAENQFTYKIDYYLVKNKKVFNHIADGVTSKNFNRPFNTNHMLFPVNLEAHSEVELYFKIRNYNKIDINFTLVTQQYLLDYYQTYNILEGMFFGGMILMMLYNLFLYFLLHIRAYLYYVFYVASLTIYFVGIFGFSQRYFESSTYIFYLSSGALFVFLTLFVQSILNLKEKLPRVHKILNLFILYFIVTTGATIYVLEMKLFYYAQLLFNIYFIFIPIFVLIIIGSTYYLAYVKKDTIAKFYSFIWSAIALVGLSLPLQYLNIIHIEIPSDYIFQFLILLEILFFSFILAYKINLLERENKEQEHILVQQNKLASMGEVVAMIAHQWRQPLSEINGVILNMDIDYRKEQLPANKFNNYLDSLENTTRHMSETINDFLDYFKHNKEVEEFSVVNLIEGTLNLISSTNKNKVDIKYIKHPEIILLSYKSELTQALLIVLNNAIDACANKDDATITISIQETDKDVVISIEDNGVGIPTNILDKIYNPYFTTKHKSKGIGLGLYILKMIIEENIQGKIELGSANGVTICNLHIPKNVINQNTFKN